jgi:SNF2 family DNA or RNA helicase
MVEKRMMDRTEIEFVEGNMVTSDVYPELGVGTIEGARGNQIRVRFHKGGDSLRTCAAGELRPYRYDLNAIVFSRTEGSYGIVQSKRESNGLVTYQVLIGPKRKAIPEFDIMPVPPASDPFDLLRQGQLGNLDTFLLSYQARRLQYAYSYDELVSLSNARIELFPHQVFVAHRALSNYPHRFLLADEVGLGKTIEAGLILKELRARDAARRVLIITPAGLVPQWVDELRKKFNEDFTRLDSVTFAAHAALHGPEGVWQAHDSIVTSMHFLRSHEEYIDLLAQQEWDLIVIDEAHHMRRYLDRGGRDRSRNTTAAYRMAERLQGRTTALLLLTATPLQLHSYELFSLVELLDPTLFPTFDDFERYRTQIPRLNNIARRLEEYEALPSADRELLAGELVAVLRPAQASGYTTLTQRAVFADLETSREARQRYQEELGRVHRLTSVMMRNRKRHVFDDMQPRRPHMLRLQFSPAERQAYGEVTTYLEEAYNMALVNNNPVLSFLMVTYRKILTSSSYALRESFNRRILRLLELSKASELLRRKNKGDFLDEAEEEDLDQFLERHADAVLDVSPAGLQMEVVRLRQLCASLDAIDLDTKAQRLLTQLREIFAANPNEKVLIFTQFKQTLLYLLNLLKEEYRTVTFYGGMDAGEKDQVVEKFRDNSESGAQIMIATEAAGEGRNLQFCHIMFNYDLPWNPMKIEQRIGRLDRIGQHHPVQIYNFAVEGTVEDQVLQVLHERIHIFESTIGNLDPILEDLERDMRNIFLSPGGRSQEEIAAFEENIARRVREAQEMESRLNDFILDTHSFRRDRADALLGRRPPFTGADIRDFMSRFVHHSNGQMRERAQGIFEIQVPRNLRTGSNRELKDSYRVTFDASVAQQHETLDFVAFGHELLDQAIETTLGDDYGNRTAHLVLKGDRIQEEMGATQAICAVYEVSFDGIRPRKQLLVLATDLDGKPLPALAGAFPHLAQHAEEGPAQEDSLRPFIEALDTCAESTERLRDEQLEIERQRRSAQNSQDYTQERQKLDRFYAARVESARRQIERLHALLCEQQSSSEPSARRIAPATQGRLAAAERALEELARERDERIGTIDKQQSVSYSSQLLSVAYITLEEPTIEVR